MTANAILLQKKYSRVIEKFAKQMGFSLDQALNFFYHSETYQLIRDGVSDMHCMSDAYLAEELIQEYAEKKIDSYDGFYTRLERKTFNILKILLYECGARI